MSHGDALPRFPVMRPVFPVPLRKLPCSARASSLFLWNRERHATVGKEKECSRSTGRFGIEKTNHPCYFADNRAEQGSSVIAAAQPVPHDQADRGEHPDPHDHIDRM